MFVPDEYRLPKEYIFSNGGGIKEIHCLDLNTNNKTLSYFFDEHDRIIGQKEHDDFITYSYNDQDKKSVENWYSYDSALIEKTIAIYDAQNKVIRKEAYK